MTYKNHALADLFPVLSPAEMTEFVKDIKAAGLLSPIVIFEGQILDGRHRYEACQIVGIEPRFEQWDGADPLEYVLSANLARRHLTVGQRAILADKVANLKPGDNQHSVSKPSEKPANTQNEVGGIPPTSRKSAAERVGASKDSVKVAHKIVAASPELAKQVEAGTMSLNKAEKMVDAAKQAAPVEAVQTDKMGFNIPHKLLPAWNLGEAPKVAMKKVIELRDLIKEAEAKQNKLYVEINRPTIMAALETAHNQLSLAVPYAVCPVCNGQKRDGCSQCKGRGFISKFLWTQTVPSEMKELRALAIKSQHGKEVDD